jgi:O-antigen/teichoic acid export membrane protein
VSGAGSGGAVAAELRRDDQIRQRVLRGSLANYAGRIVGTGTWFFITPFVLHHLGQTGFGLWVLAAALIGYGSLVELGITGAVTKYVAEFRAQDQTATLEALLGTALVLYALLGLIVGVLTLLLIPLADGLLGAAGLDAATGRAYVVLVGLTIAVTIPCLLSQAVLSGLHRYDLVSLGATLGALFSAAATVLALLAGAGLLGAVAINLLTTLVVQAINQWNLQRCAPQLRIDWRHASRPMARHVAGYSWSILVGRVAKRLKSRTDEIEVAAFMPLSAVAPYALAHRLSELAQTLADQFLRVLLPVASELDAEADTARLRQLYLTSSRLALAILVPLGCSVILLGRPMLTVWVGGEYADASYLVTLLTLAVLVETSQWPAVTVLQGMARHRPVMLVALGSAVANLLLSIVLVRSLGLAGVALGTLIPTTIENLLLVLPYTLRVMHVGLREVLERVLLPVSLPALPLLLVLLALDRAFDLTSWLALGSAAAVGLLVYVAAYLALGASSLERRLCRELAMGTLHFVGARIAWR